MLHSTKDCYWWEVYWWWEWEKLTVDDVLDEQYFRLEDEVSEDITEQIEAKQCPCEYYVKYVNNLKGYKLAQHEGV